MVEGWWIVEVGFFEVSLGNHRSDGFFCASTLPIGISYPINKTGKSKDRYYLLSYHTKQVSEQ